MLDYSKSFHLILDTYMMVQVKDHKDHLLDANRLSFDRYTHPNHQSYTGWVRYCTCTYSEYRLYTVPGVEQ